MGFSIQAMLFQQTLTNNYSTSLVILTTYLLLLVWYWHLLRSWFLWHCSNNEVWSYSHSGTLINICVWELLHDIFLFYTVDNLYIAFEICCLISKAYVILFFSFKTCNQAISYSLRMLDLMCLNVIMNSQWSQHATMYYTMVKLMKLCYISSYDFSYNILFSYTYKFPKLFYLS